MKIKDYKCKCRYNDFFFADKGNQMNIYCSYCGAKMVEPQEKDNCNTCVHYKPGNPYCECCFNLDKYEKKDKE